MTEDSYLKVEFKVFSLTDFMDFQNYSMLIKVITVKLKYEIIFIILFTMCSFI